MTLTKLWAMSQTTEQEAVLMVAIKAMERLQVSCDVTIYTESLYLTGAIEQGWTERWRENGWKTARGKPVAAMCLWEELIILLKKHQVAFETGTEHQYKQWLGTELKKLKAEQKTEGRK